MSQQDPSFHSRIVFDRVAEGDSEAAQQLFDAYVGRLIALARSRLSEKLQQRVDAEDVVQSVFRSFFVRAREGQYSVERGGDLWRLLASITRNKILKKAEHHRQQRRDTSREQSGDGGVEEAVSSRQPSQADAIVLADELDAVMRSLRPAQRTVLEMRLQGQSIPEIADALERSERTIRRYLDELRSLLEDRLLNCGS